MKSFIGAVLFICVAFSANAQLLWKVSGNGLNQPSYIIGTHHLAPFSIMDSIAGLQKAMNETQQVYNKFCKENLMLDLSAAPKLKPAFLLNNVVVAAYVKHIGKFNPQEQLDTFFQSQATQNGKKVDGLETAEFQFNLLFNGYSLQRQAQLLMCTINNINTEVESLKKLTNAYMRQDLNQMLRISEERKGNQCDPTPGEEDAMIYNRNKAWSEKLPAIMKTAPTFIAVGALHLPGDKGLLNLLKKQGYTVEPVK